MHLAFIHIGRYDIKARRHLACVQYGITQLGGWRMETWQLALRARCHVSIRQSPSLCNAILNTCPCLLVIWIHRNYWQKYQKQFRGRPWLDIDHLRRCLIDVDPRVLLSVKAHSNCVHICMNCIQRFALSALHMQISLCLLDNPINSIWKFLQWDKRFLRAYYTFQCPSVRTDEARIIFGPILLTICNKNVIKLVLKRKSGYDI